MESNHILNPDLLARISHLSIRAKAVVDGVLTGLHKSPHHGSSIEFAEHKEYTPGDDVRHIDWKAYAKFDRYYVKKFEDETNLRCLIIVDSSASMGYGEEDAQKLLHAQTIAAAFAYLLLRQQDSPGLLTFRDKVEKYIPPRATSSHYQELLEALVRVEAAGNTDIMAALEHTAELTQGRNMIVVLSDFFDPRDEVLNLLARLRSRKNEVIAMQILHRDELDFPFDYLADFEDLEDGGQVLADPDVIREEYKKVFGEFMKKIRRSCLQHGIEYHVSVSDRPPEEVILAFLRKQEAAV